MRIRSFFLLLTVTISALLIFISFALIFNTSGMHDKSNVEADALRSISVAQEVKLALLGYSRDADLAAQTGDPHYEGLKTLEKSRALSKLDEARKYVTSDEEAEALALLVTETNSYFDRFELNVRARLAPDHPSSTFLARNLDRLVEHIDAFIGINQRQASVASRAVLEWEAASNEIGRGAIVFVLLIGVIMILFFRKLIYLPLQQLSATITSYADGKSDIRAAENGPLEIREIGEAFNEMADALAQSRQQRLQFLAGVAHDLKNPLTALRGNAEVLLARNKDNKALAAPLEVVLLQVDRMNAMLHDLLDATSIEAGGLSFSKSEVDIRNAVRRSVDLFASLSPSHPLLYEPPPEDILIRADEHRIEQVLGNLIGNAIKYSPAGCAIEVGLERRDGRLQIQVRDHGIGIPPGEQERIFLPFARSKSTRYTMPGVGLGLSVSRKIAQAHDGEIQVESVLGQGSTFSLVLPLARAEQGH